MDVQSHDAVRRTPKVRGASGFPVPLKVGLGFGVRVPKTALFVTLLTYACKLQPLLAGVYISDTSVFTKLRWKVPKEFVKSPQ